MAMTERNVRAASPPSLYPSSSGRQPAPVFEFTKRKKWADLLVTELAGTIILVLSPTGEVLYCGAAAVELLGWKEEEVIDTELANWMHADDVGPFLAHFDSCITSHTEMSTFARLGGKLNDGRWFLFEFRGHPHYDEEQRDCKCFFAMARPYPSRNTAMLNSFLELKIENERLRQRLIELRPSSTVYPPPPFLSSPATSNVRNGQESSEPSLYQPSVLARPYYPAPASRPPIQDDVIPERERTVTSSKPSYPPATRVRAREEETQKEDAARKRKMRKLANGAAVQYVCVTCGRTDSPEWRKGPLGAKTLCNACGLRWAKRNQKRKTEDADAGAKDVSPNPEGDSAAAESSNRA